MNRYLTDKARKRSWWEIPLAILSALAALWAARAGAHGIDPHRLAASLAIAIGTTAAAALPLAWAIVRGKRRSDAQSMAKGIATAGQKYIPLDRLDTLTPVKKPAARLRRLIAAGYLQNLSFDEDHATLNVAILDPTQRVDAPQTVLLSEEYQDKINQIRLLNEQIEHRIVSRKIDRIEELTIGIFGMIQEKPECADDARRFINYYLPTTMKLLESYSLMEKQRFQGDNIRQSRRQIEEVLDTLIAAIEKQQDKLFRSEAMDVETDITVLKTMMTADGLRDDGLMRQGQS